MQPPTLVFKQEKIKLHRANVLYFTQQYKPRPFWKFWVKRELFTEAEAEEYIANLFWFQKRYYVDRADIIIALDKIKTLAEQALDNVVVDQNEWHMLANAYIDWGDIYLAEITSQQ